RPFLIGRDVGSVIDSDHTARATAFPVAAIDHNAGLRDSGRAEPADARGEDAVGIRAIGRDRRAGSGGNRDVTTRRGQAGMGIVAARSGATAVRPRAATAADRNNAAGFVPRRGNRAADSHRYVAARAARTAVARTSAIGIAPVTAIAAEALNKDCGKRSTGA